MGDQDLSQLPPQDLQAEQAVLGAMLLEVEAIDRAATILEPADFYSPQNGRLFEVMLRMRREKTPVDLVTLGSTLGEELDELGGAEYLSVLHEVASTAAAVEHYARLVLEPARRRVLMALGTELRQRAQAGDDVQGLCAEVQERVYRLGARREDAFEPVGEVVGRVIEQMDEQRASERHVLGISSGLPDVDTYLSGWCPSTYYVIGGMSSVGKTALLLQCAFAAAERGTGVAFFSLEMSSDNLVRRLLATRGRRDLAVVMRAMLDEAGWEAMIRASAEIYKAKLWLCERGDMDVHALRSQVTRLAAQHGIGLVVVDYLQLLSRKEEVEELTEASHGLRAMANELRLPVLVASQLSRADARRRPQLSSLRGSGSIENDADTVAFLWDPAGASDDEEGPLAEREFIIRKQRQGPLGTVHLHWDGAQQRFACMARQQSMEV